jgi:bifunctional aspartokinase / homoserine dehydrogenase 1
MKFGGTSVGDASCIARVAEIVQTHATECSVAVVVSAMSGVTNQLLEAANQSKSGDCRAVAAIFIQLHRRHEEAVIALIRSAEHRNCLQRKLGDLFLEGERFCEAVIQLGELTPRALDAILGLGERLSAPIVATALSEFGIASQAIDATELIVTDSYHGAAEPVIDLTRMCCETRVAPLLKKGVVPVVTGFIGATEEGVPTTLGRGGSDYSATILGAALNADEVIIWSDVPGLLTADPRLVEDARLIAEISYREAAELAHFGAKVLHPKTLRPMMQRRIPLWIKNTFAPEEPGTKITPAGPLQSVDAKAVTAIRDAALIIIASAFAQGVPGVFARTVATIARVRADEVFVSQTSPDNDVLLALPAPVAQSVVAALQHEFAPELMQKKMKSVICHSAVSVITLVGHTMRSPSGNAARALAALEQKDVNVVASAAGAADCSVSFVVSNQDMKTALASIHREFGLGDPAGSVPGESVVWKQAEQASAD